MRKQIVLFLLSLLLYNNTYSMRKAALIKNLIEQNKDTSEICKYCDYGSFSPQNTKTPVNLEIQTELKTQSPLEGLNTRNKKLVCLLFLPVGITIGIASVIGSTFAGYYILH